MTLSPGPGEPSRRGRILELEREALALDPPAPERDRLMTATHAYAQRFLEALPGRKTYEADKRAASRIREFRIGQDRVSIEALLDLYDEAVAVPGIAPAHGGHLGYIPGGGIYASALADYVAAVTNEYAGVRFAGPGSVEMENQVLDWLAGLVGYPEGVEGNLASGGSIANLMAIVAAREAAGLTSREIPDSVVYLTSHAHHCIAKALGVAGLAEVATREIPLDEAYRMRPDALAGLIAEDRERGLRPWLIIASAGTTDVGAIDPLPAIAEVAEAEDLWLHVDAAYGGFFALVDRCRPALAGMERADSIVLDPHKGLFLPYGTGAVLVRQGVWLRRAHTYHANYMQDAIVEELEERGSPADLSPELTKHFRGLRVWLPLLLHGVEPFRACLEEKLELARYFHDQVARLGFEVGPEPELSVSTYRWIPEDGDPNDFNRALVEYVHRDGRVFLSSTLIEGRFTLRAAVLAFRTHLDTIDLTLEILARGVEELEADPDRWRRDRPVTAR